MKQKGCGFAYESAAFSLLSRYHYLLIVVNICLFIIILHCLIFYISLFYKNLNRLYLQIYNKKEHLSSPLSIN